MILPSCQSFDGKKPKLFFQQAMVRRLSLSLSLAFSGPGPRNLLLYDSIPIVHTECGTRLSVRAVSLAHCLLVSVGVPQHEPRSPSLGMSPVVELALPPWSLSFFLWGLLQHSQEARAAPAPPAGWASLFLALSRLDVLLCFFLQG